MAVKTPESNFNLMVLRGAFRASGFKNSFRPAFFKGKNGLPKNASRSMGQFHSDTIPQKLRLSALRKQSTVKSIIAIAGARSGSMLANLLQTELELVDEEGNDSTRT